MIYRSEKPKIAHSNVGPDKQSQKPAQSREESPALFTSLRPPYEAQSVQEIGRAGPEQLLHFFDPALFIEQNDPVADSAPEGSLAGMKDLAIPDQSAPATTPFRQSVRTSRLESIKKRMLQDFAFGQLPLPVLNRVQATEFDLSAA